MHFVHIAADPGHERRLLKRLNLARLLDAVSLRKRLDDRHDRRTGRRLGVVAWRRGLVATTGQSQRRHTKEKNRRSISAVACHGVCPPTEANGGWLEK